MIFRVFNVLAVLGLCSGIIAGQDIPQEPSPDQVQIPDKPSRPEEQTQPEVPPPPPPPPVWWTDAIALSLVSDPPGAKVLLNGYLITDATGMALSTPCELPHVAPGQYTLELLGPRYTYLSKIIKVTPILRLPTLKLKSSRNHRWSDRDKGSIPTLSVDSRHTIPTHLDYAEKSRILNDFARGALRVIPPAKNKHLANATLTSRNQRRLFTLGAPLAGRWNTEKRNLRNDPARIGVSQFIWPIPFLPEGLHMEANANSDGLFELTVHRPMAHRFSGSSALTRLHFGRLGPSAESDWCELSAINLPVQPNWGFRIKPGMQGITMSLRGTDVYGTLRSSGIDKQLHRSLNESDIPENVYIGIGGGVNNALTLERISIKGMLNLAAESIDVITGMGEAFWSRKREVTLLYTTGGRAHTITLNDQTVLEVPAIPAWLDEARNLFHHNITLGFGDQLSITLTGMDDESALWLVGVDAESSRILFATHPLTWRVQALQSHNSILETDPTTPRIVSGDQSSPIAHFRKALGIDFPGLGITAPDQSARSATLTTTIR